MAHLSPETIAQLDELHSQEADYQPSAFVKAKIHDKIAVLVVGTSCQGKNTVIQEVIHQNDAFQLIGTITSQPARDTDTGLPYTYFEQSDKGLQPLIHAIATESVVQYAVNPYSHYIYASGPDDYLGFFTIGDYFSSAVEPFRKIGFQAAPAVSIISPVNDWLERFNLRFPSGHNDRSARLLEATESLNWSLSQKADHYWVINENSKADQAAESLISAVTNMQQPGDITKARQMARLTLQAIDSLGKKR